MRFPIKYIGRCCGMETMKEGSRLLSYMNCAG